VGAKVEGKVNSQTPIINGQTLRNSTFVLLVGEIVNILGL
jgi:hypothetical protein